MMFREFLNFVKDAYKSFIPLVKESPPAYRVIFAFGGLVMVLVFGFCGLCLLQSDYRQYLLVPMTGAIGLAFLTLYILFTITRDQQDRVQRVTPPGPSLDHTPNRKHREYMTMELEPASAKKILAQMVAFRKQVSSQFFESGNKNVTLNEIRSNIFLLQCSLVDEGFIPELVIHPKLHVNMQAREELKIRFRPGQSFVGTAFTDEVPNVGQVLYRKDGIKDLPDLNVLTIDQERLGHQDLKWVIAVPLIIKYSVHSTETMQDFVVGVFCLDGLKYNVDKPELEEVSSEAVNFVKDQLIPGLQAHKKTHITVNILEAPHD